MIPPFETDLVRNLLTTDQFCVKQGIVVYCLFDLLPLFLRSSKFHRFQLRGRGKGALLNFGHRSGNVDLF